MYIRALQITLLSIFILFISCSSGDNSLESGSAPVVTIDVSGALSRSAEIYKKRGNLEKAREAINILERARNLDNRNFEVEWRFARYSYYLGSRRQLSDDESEKILDKALEAARIAKRMKADRPEGHFWFGAILGELSRRSPVTVGTVSIGKIKEAMNKVIEIDPKYEGATAYDALGQLELETRGMAGGDPKKALEYFEKTFALDPKNVYVELHIGEALLALNRDPEAKSRLQSVLSMPPNPEYAPELQEAKDRAAKLLKEKFQ